MALPCAGDRNSSEFMGMMAKSYGEDSFSQRSFNPANSYTLSSPFSECSLPKLFFFVGVKE